MAFFRTSSVPPPSRYPGAPSTTEVYALVPQAPVSATRAGLRTAAANPASRFMLSDEAITFRAISGPGGSPVLACAVRQYFVVSSSARSDDIARAVWLLTAPSLIPVADAIWVSGRPAK